jgi:hypothetical protein
LEKEVPATEEEVGRLRFHSSRRRGAMINRAHILIDRAQRNALTDI